MSDAVPPSPSSGHDAAAVFDRHAATYSATIDSSLAFSGLKADFFTRVKARHLIEAARAHFGDIGHLKLLDVGCGVGNFHPLLAPHFGRLHGVDVSERSLEEARRANPGVEYAHYDGARLPFEDSTVDLTVAVCVMHHVPPEQWPLFTRECRRVLRPGGLALVYEHNPLNPVSVHVVNTCPLDEGVTLLRSGTTRTLMQDAGFSAVRTQFILAAPPVGPLLRSIDRALAGIPLGAQYCTSGVRGPD